MDNMALSSGLTYCAPSAIMVGLTHHVYSGRSTSLSSIVILNDFWCIAWRNNLIFGSFVVMPHMEDMLLKIVMIGGKQREIFWTSMSTIAIWYFYLMPMQHLEKGMT